MKKALYLLFCLCFLSACTQNPMLKINGVSFVASSKEALQEHIDPVKEVNANYASVMPFGFTSTLKDPTINFNWERQWFGETVAGVKQYIIKLHENEVKVMVKPQIWIRRGEFTGYLKMNNEEDWKTLELTYRDFILTFAKVAEEAEADIFCIGTELEQFVMNRPEFWNSLIQEIKTIYSGKLTYAANWDEYKRIPFWSELDFIGVDAYFPVSEEQSPTLAVARSSWEPWTKELETVSKKFDRPILFTEYGYRSVDYAGKEPWRSDREMTAVNLEAQNVLTQALYEEVWNQPWMAGGFLWKWFMEHENVGGLENSQFTPQNKPVQKIIKKHYEIKN